MNPIDEITERLSKATPGPWKVDDGWQDGRIYSESKNDRGDPAMTIYDEGGHSIEDAEFIAHAPEDISYLLSLLADQEERLKAADRLADAVKSLREDPYGALDAYLALREASKP